LLRLFCEDVVRLLERVLAWNGKDWSDSAKPPQAKP